MTITPGLPGYRSHTYAPPKRTGPGVAALVLGLLALPLALLCGLGAFPALGGIGFGLYAVSADRGRGLGIAGAVVSACALVFSAYVAIWFVGKAVTCGDRHHYPDRAARLQCVEREFPMVRGHGARGYDLRGPEARRLTRH